METCALIFRFFAILNSWLPLMFICYRYKSVVTMFNALHKTLRSHKTVFLVFSYTHSIKYHNDRSN